MRLTAPLIITSRLLAGARLPDGSTISLDGIALVVDLPDGTTLECDGLRPSPLMSRDPAERTRELIATWCSFLTAEAERITYGSDEPRLFPPEWSEWITENSDELAMLACELEPA